MGRLVPSAVVDRVQRAEEYWQRRAWLTPEIRARAEEALAKPGRRGRVDHGRRRKAA